MKINFYINFFKGILVNFFKDFTLKSFIDIIIDIFKGNRADYSEILVLKSHILHLIIKTTNYTNINTYTTYITSKNTYKLLCITTSHVYSIYPRKGSLMKINLLIIGLSIAPTIFI